MNDVSHFYPRVPESLITNPLNATLEDTRIARRIISNIGVKHRSFYRLAEDNLSVIPGGVRYHSVPLPNGEGCLQITLQVDKFSMLAYQKAEEFKIPELMVFNVGDMEINEVLELLCK